MQVVLGSQTHDLSCRTLVVADLSGESADTDDAAALATAGADIVAVSGMGRTLIEAVRRLEPVGVALWVTTPDAATVSSCFEAGACVASDPSGFSDPAWLAAAARAQATVVVPSGPQGTHARNAGLTTSQVIVDAWPHDDLLSHGFPVLASTARDAGTQVVAVMEGARLVCTNDVRATRRTVDTVAQLLVRRDGPVDRQPA